MQPQSHPAFDCMGRLDFSPGQPRETRSGHEYPRADWRRRWIKGVSRSSYCKPSSQFLATILLMSADRDRQVSIHAYLYRFCPCVLVFISGDTRLRVKKSKQNATSIQARKTMQLYGATQLSISCGVSLINCFPYIPHQVTRAREGGSRPMMAGLGSVNLRQ
jgi:hypothetical protein